VYIYTDFVKSYTNVLSLYVDCWHLLFYRKVLTLTLNSSFSLLCYENVAQEPYQCLAEHIKLSLKSKEPTDGFVLITQTPSASVCYSSRLVFHFSTGLWLLASTLGWPCWQLISMISLQSIDQTVFSIVSAVDISSYTRVDQ